MCALYRKRIENEKHALLHRGGGEKVRVKSERYYASPSLLQRNARSLSIPSYSIANIFLKQGIFVLYSYKYMSINNLTLI